jgi:hypothetical protein
MSVIKYSAKVGILKSAREELPLKTLKNASAFAAFKK